MLLSGKVLLGIARLSKHVRMLLLEKTPLGAPWRREQERERLEASPDVAQRFSATPVRQIDDARLSYISIDHVPPPGGGRVLTIDGLSPEEWRQKMNEGVVVERREDDDEQV